MRMPQLLTGGLASGTSSRIAWLVAKPKRRLDIVAVLSAALFFGETLTAAVVVVMYSFAEGRARREVRDLLCACLAPRRDIGTVRRRTFASTRWRPATAFRSGYFSGGALSLNLRTARPGSRAKASQSRSGASAPPWPPELGRAATRRLARTSPGAATAIKQCEGGRHNEDQFKTPPSRLPQGASRS
jgi:hypothetical protein